MVTPGEIYFLTRLDSIVIFFGIVGIVTTSIGLIWFIGAILEEDKFIKKAFFIVISGVFFIILAIATPTTKQYAAILLIPKVINNEQIQRLPGTAMELLEEQMKAWIDNLKK